MRTDQEKAKLLREKLYRDVKEKLAPLYGLGQTYTEEDKRNIDFQSWSKDEMVMHRDAHLSYLQTRDAIADIQKNGSENEVDLMVLENKVLEIIAALEELQSKRGVTAKIAEAVAFAPEPSVSSASKPQSVREGSTPTPTPSNVTVERDSHPEPATLAKSALAPEVRSKDVPSGLTGRAKAMEEEPTSTVDRISTLERSEALAKVVPQTSNIDISKELKAILTRAKADKCVEFLDKSGATESKKMQVDGNSHWLLDGVDYTLDQKSGSWSVGVKQQRGTMRYTDLDARKDDPVAVGMLEIIGQNSAENLEDIGDLAAVWKAKSDNFERLLQGKVGQPKTETINGIEYKVYRSGKKIYFLSPRSMPLVQMTSASKREGVRLHRDEDVVSSALDDLSHARSPKEMDDILAGMGVIEEKRSDNLREAWGQTYMLANGYKLVGRQEWEKNRKWDDPKTIKVRYEDGMFKIGTESKEPSDPRFMSSFVNTPDLEEVRQYFQKINETKIKGHTEFLQSEEKRVQSEIAALQAQMANAGQILDRYNGERDALEGQIAQNESALQRLPADASKDADVESYGEWGVNLLRERCDMPDVKADGELYKVPEGAAAWFFNDMYVRFDQDSGEWQTKIGDEIEETPKDGAYMADSNGTVLRQYNEVYQLLLFVNKQNITSERRNLLREKANLRADLEAFNKVSHIPQEIAQLNTQLQAIRTDRGYVSGANWENLLLKRKIGKAPRKPTLSSS